MVSKTKSRVIKNTGFLYVKMGITIFISLYTTRLLLGALGASDFGLYNIIGGAILMLGFLNNSLASVTQRFISYAEGEGNLDKKKSIFNTSLLLHIAIAFFTGLVLLAIMYPLFHFVLNIAPGRECAGKMVYICLVTSTILTIINVPYDAVMNAHENMFYYSVIGIVEAFLKLAVAFACFYTSGDKLILYAILMMIIPFITLSIMKLYCHKKYGECNISFSQFWNKSIAKEIMSFFGWNFISSASWFLSNFGVNLVLNNFYGTLLNAAQGIANQVNGQMSSFSGNMLKAINPIIVKRAGANDYEAMNRAAVVGGLYSTLLIVLFAIPFIIEMPYVLKLWLKNVPEWTSLFCVLQLIITLICQTACSASTSIFADGHIKGYSIYKSITNFLPIILTYMAFKFGGAPYWLYVITIMVYAIGGNIIIIKYAHTHCGFSARTYFFDIVIPVIIVSLLMFVSGKAVTFGFKESFVRVLITCSVTSCVFLVLLWFYVLRRNERTLVKVFFITKLNQFKINSKV